MKPLAFTTHKCFKPSIGALLVILAGLALWALPRGELWRLKSYDLLFHFATRRVTNQLVLVFMDNQSFDQIGRPRTNGWERGRHAKFLDRLAKDGCPLVVFDVFFNTPRDPTGTVALVDAMSRFSNVVLTTKLEDVLRQPDPDKPGVVGIFPVQPLEIFFDAVRRTNWGVGFVGTNDDCIARQHWRYPSPGIYESVAWTAANLAGARLSNTPEERWIRYYAPGYAWKSWSYVDAELLETNYFRNKVVFIGNKPVDNLPDGEQDEFLTPFSDRNGPTVGGVEILATEFLNLWNHEWLRRPPWWVEILVLNLTGMALGFGLVSRRILTALVATTVAAFLALAGGVYLSYFTNYWFPWLIVAGAQVPLAFGLTVWHQRESVAAFFAARYKKLRGARQPTIALPLPEADQLETPDYKRVEPPFGKGAYGQVWIARNAVGQWQAVKAIYRKHFGDDASPYEREFKGIERYKPVSDKHPGLLRVDFVSMMKPQGYFYYVMELGDAVTPGWETNPMSYKPLDLAALCGIRDGRLAAAECVRIGTKICEALEFLHSQGLAHRDIKPRNIIFVKGQPKLADVGLVADARRPEQEITLVGTPGFMPPEPEPPGTVAADVYGLGMVLYVISTGSKPAQFPELSEAMIDPVQNPDFGLLVTVIFKACQPDRSQRYGSAAEMLSALQQVDEILRHKKVPT